MTETIIPIKNGCCCVAILINSPKNTINFEIGGPKTRPTAEPATIVTKGVIKISTFVLPATKRPT